MNAVIDGNDADPTSNDPAVDPVEPDLGGGGGSSKPLLLAAGYDRTCVVTQKRKLKCFGENGNGELYYGNANNYGDNELLSTVDPIIMDKDVLQVAVAPTSTHACLLLAGGSVRCFGSSFFGQLGYNNTDNLGDDPGETPDVLADVDVGGTVTQLALGSYHTCALLDTGAVRCWGNNADGQLGYGNTNNIGDDEDPSAAGDVDVGGSVKQIIAGYGYTCALLNSGNVRCWGAGNTNLGYGNFDTIGDNETPSSAGDIDVGETVTKLAGGDTHICALLTTGKMRCWGNNSSGQLGYGNTTSIGGNQTPASVGDNLFDDTVSQMDLGDKYTCVRSGETLKCFGENGNGQLGQGDTADVSDPTTLSSIHLGVNINKVATGSRHVCVGTKSAQIKCFGYGGSGQLGYGNTNDIGDDELPSSVNYVTLY